MEDKIKLEFDRGNRRRIKNPVHKVVAAHEEDKDLARARYIPKFKNPKEFADKKIMMLREHFCINLSAEDEAFIRKRNTEHEINAAFKMMLNKYWK